MTNDEPTTPAASATVKLGHEWAVPVNASAEVSFTSPSGREYTVHTRADGHGGRQAVLVLDEAGDWSAVASNGDEFATSAK